MKYKLKNKTRFITFIALLILTIAIYPKSEPQELWTEYYVQEGNTLWSIVDNNYSDNVRRDEIIYEIRQHNKLGKYIQVGQVIEIPEYGLK